MIQARRDSSSYVKTCLIEREDVAPVNSLIQA
jgi:hypothetical protein